jgi:CheY-like chemotaxis protein
MSTAAATNLVFLSPPVSAPAPAPVTPHLTPVTTSGNKRRILVLEDDPAFREIVQCYFEEHGLGVVSVQNGVEGVHEILAGDFDGILCDMQMPTLPGDMFYRAVERMRPHLCDRFVFMTGYRGNTKVNEFIASVDGMVLIKPFHMDDLQEMLAFLELREVLLAA